MASEETNIKLTYSRAFATNALRNKSSKSTQKRTETLTEIKTCLINTESKLTVIGQSDGTIVYWRPSKTDKLTCYQYRGHKNASVYSLCYDTKHGLIISGGNDAKMKLYDPWHRTEKSKIFPISELKDSHSGTILCLTFSKHSNQIISSSTDCTVRISNVLRKSSADIYPRIHCQQILKFDTWVRAVTMTANNKHLMIGDDRGILYAYQTQWHSNIKQMSQNSHDCQTSVRSKVQSIFVCDAAKEYSMDYYSQMHRLSITFVLFVPNLNYIITLSSDYTLQIHDSTTCAAIFGVRNPQNCKYMACDYNYHTRELFVVDEHGILQIWNIQKEECLYAQQLRKACLFQIKCVSHSQIQVTTADCIEVWNIDRVKRAKVGQGHSGDVISLVIIEPNTSANESSVTESESQFLETNLRNLDTVMYSVAVDNSIRAWDIQTMHCRGIFDSNGKESSLSEISTLTHLKGTQTLVTGHHNGALFCWNTYNASNRKLPKAHTDAITKVCHYKYDKEMLFSIAEDGLLAVYALESKNNERIFHWQKSIILNDRHGMLSIVCNKQFCYIGSSNGDVYEYDIEMCKVSQILNVCPNNICDLQIDANFLFIACEFGDIIIWELSLGFAMDTINISHSNHQKCVGMYYESESHLLLFIYDCSVIVYDYVLGLVKETIHFQHFIASFAFYDGSVFCGSKNAIINRTKLNSFRRNTVSESRMEKWDRTANANKVMTPQTRLQSVAVSNRRALQEIQPTIHWKVGDREFNVNFNQSFGK